MSELTSGTVLSCAHEGCGCRVVIQEVCHCEGTTADSTYTCACGAPMVVVDVDEVGGAGGIVVVGDPVEVGR